MELNREKAIEILEKFDMFQGQRAGRELWQDKPFEVQEQDIANFSRDVNLLIGYIKELTEESQRWQQAYDCSDSACRELSSKCDELTAKTKAQDIVILELRKSLEKANHDADRYTLKIKELTEEVEGLQRELASRPPRLVITKLPKESEKEDV